MTSPTNSTSSLKLPSNTVYDRLKLTAILLLPAIGALYFGLAQIWGWPAADKVSGTISVLNAFVGVAVAWLKSLYTASGAQYDGEMTWTAGEEEGDSFLRMKSVDIRALETKGEILLKVTGRPGGE